MRKAIAVEGKTDVWNGPGHEEAKRPGNAGRLQRQLRQSLPLLRELFLERLAALGLSGPEIEEGFACFGLRSLTPPALVMVADIDDCGEREASKDGERSAAVLRAVAFRIFEETAAKLANPLVFRTREKKLAAIVHGVTNKEELYGTALGLAEEVRRRVEEEAGVTVTIGIGHSCASAERLPVSYKSALTALGCRFLYGKNRVLGIRGLKRVPDSAALFSWDEDRKLAAAVKTGEAAETFGLIERMTAQLRASRLPLTALGNRAAKRCRVRE